MPDFSHERFAGGRVAGVDEAGRGPLAGPVLAAALVFTRGVPRGMARLLDDSKKLTVARRHEAFAALQLARAAGRVEFAIAAASAAEIGRVNILQATYLAMQRAVGRLPSLPDVALVDGNRAPAMPCRTMCIVDGDALSLSIAGASILAKVMRDRAMARLCARWPVYGFSSHMGYASRAHRAALEAYGPCPHHRRGFAPVETAYQRSMWSEAPWRASMIAASEEP